MAVSMDGGYTRSSGRFSPMSQINVTPFVDVMLVLLIVFMITAPLLTVGVPVDLPQGRAAPITDEVEPVTLTVDAAGELYLQETKITLDELVPRLLAISESRRDSRIYVRGDKAVAYGRVMSVMSVINAAGFTKVALITQPPTGAGRR